MNPSLSFPPLARLQTSRLIFIASSYAQAFLTNSSNAPAALTAILIFSFRSIFATWPAVFLGNGDSVLFFYFTALNPC